MQALSTGLGAQTSVRAVPVLLLFSVTLFIGSGLLFLVEPMFAKMALPLLGGTPQVWNSCMLFFQATLLAGYAYAHFSHRLVGVRFQRRLHAALLLLPFVILPIAIPAGTSPPQYSDPTLWLIGLLLTTVGLPFFVVSTNGPLLQRWFAETDHPRAGDPYFLYAASNCGSMLALCAYPLLLEPFFTLERQSEMWTYLYGLFAILTVACAAALVRFKGAPKTRVEIEAVDALKGKRRARWTLLGFLPSSLLLGVTTYFTSDLAAVPLFWVIPLALYLLTFILVFARKPPIPHRLMVKSLNTVLLSVVLVTVLEIAGPLAVVAPLHLVGFFVIAMVCHGELAADRPHAAHLTEFYLWLGIGGVLGGAFNAVVAPVLFNSAVEYPLALVVAAFLCPPRPSLAASRRRVDVVAALVVGGVAVAAALSTRHVEQPRDAVRNVLLAGAPILLCMSAVGRPLRFGLSVAAFVAAFTLFFADEGAYRARSFFGVHKVVTPPTLGENRLLHGTTVHGVQRIDGQARPTDAREPLGYYHPSGPIGQYLTAVAPGRHRRIAILGLGTGGLLAYFGSKESVTYYEIDPVVVEIAERSGYFSFLREARARGVDVHIELGDARLTLASAPDAAYDLVIVDVFSSDHIPMHLATLEAFSVYLRKLSPHGVITWHISNRYLDLTAVAENAARRLNLAFLRQRDPELSEDKMPSHWALYARGADDLKSVWKDPRWEKLSPGERGLVWTDNFSNVVGTLELF